MKENKETKKNGGVGFYLALCCCVAAIGIVGFYNSTKEEVPTEDTVPISTEKVMKLPVITLPPIEEDVAEPEKKNETQIVPETEQVISMPYTATETEKANVETEDFDVIEYGENSEFYDGDVIESVSLAETPAFMFPVIGEVCKKYSENLQYDNVYGDYRTHNGVDIKSEKGADVTAADDGVIEKVYTDVLGKTIIIDHENGYKSKYSNLDGVDKISEGQKVMRGDRIACVGEFSVGETAIEPHIHFEIIRDGEFLNPEEFLD